jgi:adenylate cyclase
MARRAVLLLFVAALGVGAGFAAKPALHRLELVSVDARFKIRSDDTTPRGVAVLGVDAAAIRRLGALPFPRSRHARAIAALKRAGAQVIAYDFEFAGETKIAEDNALLLALRRAGNVVVATGNDAAVLGGAEGQAFARVKVGLAGFTANARNIVRRVHDELEGAPTFAATAVRRAGERVPPGASWIDYRGDVEVIPFLRALDGDLPDLDGRIVVVGDTDFAGRDTNSTPLGTRAGPEVNAIAIDTLLRGAPLRSRSGWPLIVLLGVLVPLSALALKGLRWLPVAALLAVAWPVAAQLAFNADRIWPFVPGAVALAVSALGTLVVTYAVDIRARRHLRAQFARFAPPSVVDSLVDAGSLPGTRTEATVLFCDLRGFTAAAERLGAEGVIALLNRYLSSMSDAILDHGGTVVSFMGDGIMAVFGAPVAQPDHADRAVAAARELIGPRLAAFNAETGESFAMGVGIASGPVMSGTVGSARRIEYATVGETTNLAARLESLTKEGPPVLIADSTKAALQREAALSEAGERTVRGVGTPVRVWTLL